VRRDIEYIDIDIVRKVREKRKKQRERKQKEGRENSRRIKNIFHRFFHVPESERNRQKENIKTEERRDKEMSEEGQR
jgi:hypothetical protein